MRDPLERLIAPRSIALIGAGAWTDAVAAANAALGYPGAVWRVHPTRASSAQTPYYRSIADLPDAPDAAFVAVPNTAVPDVAAALAARGAGGFVCFSAGFSETGAPAGRLLSERLVQSAASLPFFGPNCYGFVNFFERAALLPDQVVGGAVDSGVALICQSGTIALTLMFNDRSLPIGCLFTVGNQTRLAVEDLIERLSDDPRITAFGLYLEGIKDAAALARAAATARARGKPIAVVKSGRTEAAQRTAHSHTGALAGADDVFEAFCRQAGIARCDTLATLCETLKLFHLGGALTGTRILVMGASGGDMAMTADVARSLPLEFAPLPAAQATQLSEILTERVTVANPFDLHTYLWFDPPALGRVFRIALEAGYDAVGFMLDCPPEHAADTAAFDAVIDVFIAAAAVHRATRAVLIASLPETLSARVRQRCLAGGVVPLQGQREALEALALAGALGHTWRGAAGVALQIPAPPAAAAQDYTLLEADGKAVLAGFGVPVPRGRVVPAGAAAAAAETLGFPVAMKAVSESLQHKSEAGGVIVNVNGTAQAQAAAAQLARLSGSILVEEMIADGVVEILAGVTVDAHFGQVLVIGSGGVLTEWVADCVSLLPPWNAAAIAGALERLSAARLLRGFRGKPPGDVAALVRTILAIAQYACHARETLVELDVNPIIVRPAGRGVVAVDALIRLHRPLQPES